MRVTLMPYGLSVFTMYRAVVSPSNPGLVARITSMLLLISGVLGGVEEGSVFGSFEGWVSMVVLILFSSSAIFSWSGPMPSTGESEPWRTW